MPRLVDDDSGSDSGSDSDLVSNDLTESAGSVLGSEKKGEADGNVAMMMEMLSAKRTVSVRRNVEVMNYDAVKGTPIAGEPSQNGVERADGDTLSWAAVVKKD